MHITKTIEVDIDNDKEYLMYQTKQEIYQELAKQYDLFGLDGLLNHLRKNCNDNRLNDWISVDERLPDIPDVYLAYQSNVVCFQHKKEKLCLTTFHPDAGWGSCSRVTHWQPLPQPPKEQSK